jgi:hypothetical protein
MPEFELNADPLPPTPDTTVLPEIVTLPVWAVWELELPAVTLLLVEKEAEFEFEQLTMLKDPGPVVEIDPSPQVSPVETNDGVVFSMFTVFEPWFSLTALPLPPIPVTRVLPVMVTLPLEADWLEALTAVTSLSVDDVNRFDPVDEMMLVERGPVKKMEPPPDPPPRPNGIMTVAPVLSMLTLF